MAKIIAPNKQYTGVSAGVAFAGGVGRTDDPERVAWFTRNGYTIADEDVPAGPSVDKAEYDRLLAENAELTKALQDAIARIEQLEQLPQPSDPAAKPAKAK